MSSTIPSLASTAQRKTVNHRPRHWLPYAGVIILLGLIVAGLWPKPVPVEIARAAMGTLRATVNEEGKTRIRQRYVVSAPVTGQLRRISFKAGAEVQAGQTVVAVIDPLSPAMLDARTRSTTEARRDTAAANLEKAQAAHAFEASELQRYEKLYADQTISIQELEAAKWRESSAAKDYAAAQSALRQAQAELTEGAGSAQTPAEVKSPISGRVLRVVEESSRVVSAGAPLLEVGDPGDLEVAIEVLSRDGAVIVPGEKVELEQWGGGQPLTARVRLVEPAAFTKVSALGVEEQRVNVIADLLTPPAERPGVGDNFRVEARIITWESDHTLKVPSGALFRQGEQWAAYVVSEGRAHLRAVQASRSSGAEIQVLGGLKEGDEVILYPGNRVHDGLRVKPVTI